MHNVANAQTWQGRDRRRDPNGLMRGVLILGGLLMVAQAATIIWAITKLVPATLQWLAYH